MKQKVVNIEEIGLIVKARRKTLGLTQADAAGLLGVGIRFLSELERGKETLVVGKVLKVLLGLKINMEVSAEIEK